MNPVPPLCTQIGMMHGVVVGFMFGLLQFGLCCRAMPGQLVLVALVLAALAALVSLFSLSVMSRYAITSVLPAIIVNAVIVAFAVVFAMNAIGPSMASIVIGLVLGPIAGLIVGRILCLLCGVRSSPRDEDC